VLTNQKVEIGDVLNLIYNKRKEAMEAFRDEPLLDSIEGLSLSQPPLVKTANAKQALLNIRPWLRHAESFVVIGPEGCGKT
jgi:hypothetical protein